MWVDAVKDLGPGVHHRDIVAAALEELEQELAMRAGGGKPDTLIWHDLLLPENRSTFIKKILDYVTDNELDGVDVDVSLFEATWVEGGAAARVEAARGQQDEVAQLHARWADAQWLHQQGDRLHAQAAAIEQQVIARKVALGLQSR